MDIGRWQVMLVLGGGGALGAFEGGLYEALDEAGIEADWLAGSSIGALNAALIAGSRPGDRAGRLRAFWERLSDGNDVGRSSSGETRRVVNLIAAAWSRALGRPALFGLALPRLFSGAHGWGLPSLYDYRPAFKTLEELVDFDLLAAGTPRLTVNATDLVTGEAVRFDSRRERLTAAHLLASAALIPDFAPFEIGGRMICDGGFSENVPLHAVLGEPPEADTLCIAVDLYSRAAEPVWSVDGMAERRGDLAFASQTRWSLEALKASYGSSTGLRPEGASVALATLSYDSRHEGIAQKIFDYSRRSIEERWAAGRDQGRELVARLRAMPEPDPGRLVHLDVPGRQAANVAGAEAAGSPPPMRNSQPRPAASARGRGRLSRVGGSRRR
jgi:NTE family protein